MSPSRIHYLAGSPLFVKPVGHYVIQASSDGWRTKFALHLLQPPNQLETPGRQISHSVAFYRLLQGSVPSRAQASFSVRRLNPVTHSHRSESKSRTVLPEISHASQVKNPLGHAPHSGSTHRLAQSLGRIQGPIPQPQSLHESSKNV
jgi:hypothetical protein